MIAAVLARLVDDATHAKIRAGRIRRAVALRRHIAAHNRPGYMLAEIDLALPNSSRAGAPCPVWNVDLLCAQRLASRVPAEL